jgi:hypothetical protein
MKEAFRSVVKEELRPKRKGIASWGRKLLLSTILTVSILGIGANSDAAQRKEIKKPKPVSVYVQLPGETPINPSINFPAMQPVQGKKEEKTEPVTVSSSTTITWNGKTLKYTLETRDDWNYINICVDGRSVKTEISEKNLKALNYSFTNREVFFIDNSAFVKGRDGESTFSFYIAYDIVNSKAIEVINTAIPYQLVYPAGNVKVIFSKEKEIVKVEYTDSKNGKQLGYFKFSEFSNGDLEYMDTGIEKEISVYKSQRSARPE